MDRLSSKWRIAIAAVLVVAVAFSAAFGIWSLVQATGSSVAPQTDVAATSTTEDTATSTSATSDSATSTDSSSAQSDQSSSATTNAETSSEQAKPSEQSTEDKTAKSEPIEQHQGTLAVATAGDAADPVLEEDTIPTLISVTLQDESIDLPCAMQDLLAKGWEADAFDGDKTSIEASQNLKAIPLHAKDDPKVQIEVDASNLNDEATTWDQAFCTGIRVRTEKGASLKSAAGFGTDSTFDDVYNLLGAGTNAKHEGKRREVSLQIYVNVGEEDQRPIAGEVMYAAEDGKEGLSELYIALTSFKERPDSEGQQMPEGPGMGAPDMGGPGMSDPGMGGPGMGGPGMGGPGMGGPGMGDSTSNGGGMSAPTQG